VTAGRARGAYLAALGATVIWGINYSVAKRVLAEIDPLAVAFVRAAGSATVFALLLAARRGFATISRADLWRAAPLGLLGITANQFLFIVGLSHTSASHSGILIAMLPVYVLGLSVLSRQESLTLPRTAGIAVALAGVALVALEKGIDFRSEYLKGDLITIAAGLSFACYTVAGKPVLRDLGALRTTTLAFLTGAPALIVLGSGPFMRQPWASVSTTALYGLGFMVFLGTISAYLLYYFAVSRIDPSQVAAFMYLQPLVAALVAFTFAGERLTRSFVVGGMLVLAGVLITERVGSS